MAGLDTTEIDAINSTEQENVGQKMDVYQSLKTLKDVESRKSLSLSISVITILF